MGFNERKMKAFTRTQYGGPEVLQLQEVDKPKIKDDHVIPYDKDNIHQHKGKYDLIIDTQGNLSFEDFKRMGQRGVMVGFTTIGHMMSVLLKSAFNKFPLIQFTAEANTKDLEILAHLIQKKEIRVHIEKVFPYKKIPEAICYIEAKRTKGKVAMVWKAVEED